jgi:hypothetical protein
MTLKSEIAHRAKNYYTMQYRSYLDLQLSIRNILRYGNYLTTYGGKLFMTVQCDYFYNCHSVSRTNGRQGY